MEFLRLLFDFRGRMRRRTWWLINLPAGFLSILAAEIAVSMTLGPRYSYFGGDPGYFSAGAPALVRMVASLPFAWIALSTGIKRRHDRGKRGGDAVALIALGFLPYAAPFLGPMWLWTPLEEIIFAFSFVLGLTQMILFGFLNGTPGPNRYGPSPKGLGDQADTFT